MNDAAALGARPSIELYSSDDGDDGDGDVLAIIASPFSDHADSHPLRLSLLPDLGIGSPYIFVTTGSIC